MYRLTTERKNNAYKYKDVISKSVLIEPESSPAIYQIKPIKEELGHLTRMTFGKRNLNKVNKTILLVGETGAGKSTLINSMVNYLMGIKWEDRVWFQIVEEDRRSQSESLTSDVIVYEIFGFEEKVLPYSLSIIDTPGFGDTRGLDNDTMVSHRLFDLFRSEDGVNEIHAVGIVMKATDNRVNERLSYVLNSVMSLFGKNLEKNIVALFTNSDGREPKNAIQALLKTNIKCAKTKTNQPVYFLFDNCQHEDRTEDTDLLKVSDEISEKGMGAFTAFLDKTEPKRLTTTTEVLNERISLTAAIYNLQDRIDETEKKQKEVRKTQSALKKHEEEIRKNQNFTMEIDQVYKMKEQITSGRWYRKNAFEKALSCLICEETCHYPGCTLILKPQQCEVMKKGHCTVCTKRCPASAHVRESWKFVSKTKKVQYTVKDIEDRYMMHKGKSEKKLNLLKTLEYEIEQLSVVKSHLVDEAYLHVVRLEQIALQADSVSTFVYMDFLIEKMKEKGDATKVRKLEEMKSREDEGTRLALQYMWGKTMNP